MIVSLIAAVSKNRVIGKNNDLPWKLPDDMKYFMDTTRQHAVIMGRKNFDSLPPKYKPLRDRLNIVVTRHKEALKDFDVRAVGSIAEAFEQAPQSEEVFVIGGAEIFSQTLARADRLYITEIDAVVDGDVYFPEYDKSRWKEVSRIHHNTDERHAFSFDFVLYERVK
jgi:dihydrofolate reductase